MEGFLNLRLPQWARRLLTRGLAVAPVVAVTILYGDRGITDLLVFSQVILSLQLPFAMVPLIRFVTNRELMGRFVISRATAALTWVIAAVIIVLNVKVVTDALLG
jgi:manganese transport protein